MQAVIETGALMAPSGEAVAHVEHDGERRAILVRGAAPGETVRASFDLAARPARGEIVEIVTPSAARALPACAFVEACGGCDWMHLSRDAQRAQHIALAPRSDGVEARFHAAPRDLAYRTRARVHAREERGRMHVGFFGARSRDLVEVSTCVVLDPRIDEARASLGALFAGAHGEGEIGIALGKNAPVADVRWSRDLPAAIFARLDEAVRDGRIGGFRVLCGESRRPAVFGDPTPWISGADGAPLELAPGGFSQAHEGVNVALASRVAELAKGARKVVELYAGAGNLTVLLARDETCEVRAVESSELACDAARRNLAARSLKARVTCADAARFEIATGADAVVLDPPRTGARDACAALAKGPRSVKRVVYVACDRMTLARDLELLAPRFRVASIDVFEMFPHTSHAETVVLLERVRA